MKEKIKSLLLIAIVSTVSASCKHDNDNLIKIYKDDGSISCVSDSSIELSVMEQDLIDIGIDVICSQKGDDGEQVPAICDITTGKLNIYTINSSNLPDAENIGFNSVNELPKYQDAKCE